MSGTTPTYVTPKSGSGGLNLRSQPLIDPATRIGGLSEGTRLELEQAGTDWHACRVYVSTQFAEAAGDSFVTLKPGAISSNVRLAPVLSDATDVGDLISGQRLELVQRAGDWWIARVYSSAQFSDLVTDTAGTTAGKPPKPATILSPAEVQALPLVPAQRRDVPPGLSSAAISAASIWNKYGGMIEPLAAKIGIDPAVAVAVVSVESGGRGVGPDGRMIIRFENHVFWSLWGKANPDAYNALFAFNPPPGKSYQGHKYRANPNAPWQDVHASQASEWDAFRIASNLNANAARQSISMGLAQIMGFNFKTVGYDSVEAMFEAYAADERWQLLGLFSYIVSRGLVARLQQGDYVGFALGYNGKGQEQFYAGLIQQRRDAFLSLPAPKGFTRALSLGLPALGAAPVAARRSGSKSTRKRGRARKE